LIKSETKKCKHFGDLDFLKHLLETVKHFCRK